MRYGDIFEIDGQLYEVTPVGYRPVSPTRDVSNQRRINAPAGMLTQEKDVGNNLEPGDPVQPSPTPAPQPEPAPEPAPQERTYTYVREMRDLAGGETRNVWDATSVRTISGHAGLTELYNSRKEYQQIFGSADRFISYMDEMYDLQQTNPEFMWWKTDTAEQFADANGYPPEAAYEGLEAAAQREFDREYLDYQRETREQQFNAMVASDEYTALAGQYNLNQPVKNDDGDLFVFNGGFPVEVSEVPDHLSAVQIGEIFAGVAVSALLGGANLGNVIASSLQLGTTSTAVVSSAINSVINQAAQSVLSGQSFDLNLNSVLQAAVTGGLLDTETAQEALQAIQTGSESIDAALQAGVINAATQLAISGEISPEQLAQTMLQAGLEDEFRNYLEDLENLTDATADQLEEFFGGWVPDVSAIEDFLAEQEGFFDAEIPDYIQQFEDIVQDAADVVSEAEEELEGLVYQAGEGYIEPGSYDYYIDADGNRLFQSQIEGLVFDSNTGQYVDSDGNVYSFGGNGVVNNDGTIDYYDGYTENLVATGRVELSQDGIYDSDGNLAYYQDEGQWYDAQGNIVDDPSLVDELVGIASGGVPYEPEQIGSATDLEIAIDRAINEQDIGSVIDFMTSVGIGVNDAGFFGLYGSDQEILMDLFGVSTAQELATALAQAGYTVLVQGDQVVIDFNYDRSEEFGQIQEVDSFGNIVGIQDTEERTEFLVDPDYDPDESVDGITDELDPVDNNEAGGGDGGDSDADPLDSTIPTGDEAAAEAAKDAEADKDAQAAENAKDAEAAKDAQAAEAAKDAAERAAKDAAAESAKDAAERSDKETAEQAEKDAAAETAEKEEAAAEQAQKDAAAETAEKEEAAAENAEKEAQAETDEKEAEAAERADKEAQAETQEKEQAAGEQLKKDTKAETQEKEEAAAEQAEKDQQAEEDKKELAETEGKDAEQTQKDQEAEQEDKETAAEETQKEAEAENVEKEEVAAEQTQKEADAETAEKEEQAAEEAQKDAEAETQEKEAQAAEEAQKDAEAETEEKETQAAEEAQKDAEAETQEKDVAEQQQKEAENQEKETQAEQQEKEAENQEKEEAAAEQAEKEAEQTAKDAEAETADKEAEAAKDAEAETAEKEAEAAKDAESETAEKEAEEQQKDADAETQEKEAEAAKDAEAETAEKEAEAAKDAETETAEKEAETQEKDGTGDGDGDGTGDGTGDGDGDGDGDGSGIGLGGAGLMATKADFKPFMSGISYTPVQIQEAIAPQQRDYMQQLEGLIGRSLFGRMI